MMESNRVDIKSILWRGFALPGHEVCRLFFQDSEWHLEGAAVFSHEGQPVQLNYQIICDAAWQTLSANVEGWLGQTVVGIQIKTDPTQRWWLNQVEQPDLMGCIDLRPQLQSIHQPSTYSSFGRSHWGGSKHQSCLVAISEF